MARGRKRMPPGSYGAVEPRNVGTKKAPRWYVDIAVRLPDGTADRVRITRPSKAEALAEGRALAREKAEGDAGATIAGVNAGSLLPAFLAAYLDAADIADSTRAKYADITTRHIVPALGALQVREVTTPTVEGYLQGLKTTPGIWRTARAVLSGAWTWAVRMDVVKENIIRGTTSAPTTTSDPHALSADEIATWHAAALAYSVADIPGRAVRAPWAPRLVHVLAGTGARPGEGVAMQWEDIAGDLAGDGPVILTIRGTKTSGSLRTVTLPRYAVRALREQREHLGEMVGLSPWVWATGTGRPITPSRAALALRKIAEHHLATTGADLPPISPGTFRASAATIIADAAGPYAAAAQLGHSGIGVTERHYLKRGVVDQSAHLDAAYDAAAADQNGN